MVKVYAISAGVAIKFGVTNGVIETRLSALQTGNHVDLRIVSVYEPKSDDAYVLEATIYEVLSADKIRGEWYFPTQPARNIIRAMNNGYLEKYLQNCYSKQYFDVLNEKKAKLGLTVVDQPARQENSA